MNHLLQQLRRQQRFYFSTHSFCIMSQAARGTLMTILIMLAEAINDAVTEQRLHFKKMVVMLARGGMWGSPSIIYHESVCYAVPSSRPAEQHHRRVI